MTALRALLEGIVDYAGLFPPAALDMRTAVANYAEYRHCANAWMLGRFVVPVTRLQEIEGALPWVHEGGAGWALSAVSGDDILGDLERVQAFNARAPEGRRIDTIEAKLATPDAIANGGRVAQAGFSVFAEIPVRDDPARLVSAIREAEINAKMRMGGVTADAFPPAEHVVRFMSRCMEADVPFKLTAGLHHAICAEYPLTYESNAARGAMFGYLNVFLAAVALRQGARKGEIMALLRERDARAFSITDDAVSWRPLRFTTGELAETRERAAVAFGSCSFREPVDDLRSLGFRV